MVTRYRVTCLTFTFATEPASGTQGPGCRTVEHAFFPRRQFAHGDTTASGTTVKRTRTAWNALLVCSGLRTRTSASSASQASTRTNLASPLASHVLRTHRSHQSCLRILSSSANRESCTRGNGATSLFLQRGHFLLLTG